MTIINDIEAYIKKYVVMPHDEDYRVMATYVIHTWSLESANTTPYLYIHSPEAGSGKTTLMEVLATLCDSPELTANLTAPTLMNLVDSSDHLTLFYDEIDTMFASNSATNKQMQGVLNSGYRRGNTAFRVQGDGVRKIKVFCPKVLGGINNGALPSSLADRCLPVHLTRKRHDQKLQPFYPSVAKKEAAPLWDAIEVWVSEHSEKLAEYVIPDLDWNPRTLEIATPLLAIANEFGILEEITSAIHRMVTEYKSNLASQDKSLDFLRTMAAIFAIEGGTVFTDQIADYMGMPKSMKSYKEIALLAGRYNADADTVRVGNKRQKGYTMIQFAMAMDAAGLLSEDGSINEDALT